MKSRRLVIAAAAAAGMLAALATLSGCSQKAPEKVRIAMVVKSLGNGFFDAAHAGADEAAAQLKNVLSLWGASGSYASRANAVRPLLASSVVNDLKVDRLTGNGGVDWFFRSPNDQLRDRTGAELIN